MIPNTQFDNLTSTDSASVFGALELAVVTCEHDERHPFREWTASTGIAFVRFARHEDAVRALDAIDSGNVKINGVRVRGAWAREDTHKRRQRDTRRGRNFRQADVPLAELQQQRRRGQNQQQQQQQQHTMTMAPHAAAAPMYPTYGTPTFPGQPSAYQFGQQIFANGGAAGSAPSFAPPPLNAMTMMNGIVMSAANGGANPFQIVSPNGVAQTAFPVGSTFPLASVSNPQYGSTGVNAAAAAAAATNNLAANQMLMQSVMQQQPINLAPQYQQAMAAMYQQGSQQMLGMSPPPFQQEHANINYNNNNNNNSNNLLNAAAAVAMSAMMPSMASTHTAASATTASSGANNNATNTGSNLNFVSPQSNSTSYLPPSVAASLAATSNAHKITSSMPGQNGGTPNLAPHSNPNNNPNNNNNSITNNPNGSILAPAVPAYTPTTSNNTPQQQYQQQHAGAATAAGAFLPQYVASVNDMNKNFIINNNNNNNNNNASTTAHQQPAIPSGSPQPQHQPQY